MSASINPLVAKLIIGADMAWVAASAVGLVLFAHHLSYRGAILVEFTAVIVFGFALLQIMGLKKMTAGNRTNVFKPVKAG